MDRGITAWKNLRRSLKQAGDRSGVKVWAGKLAWHLMMEEEAKWVTEKIAFKSAIEVETEILAFFFFYLSPPKCHIINPMGYGVLNLLSCMTWWSTTCTSCMFLRVINLKTLQIALKQIVLEWDDFIWVLTFLRYTFALPNYLLFFSIIPGFRIFIKHLS